MRDSPPGRIRPRARARALGSATGRRRERVVPWSERGTDTSAKAVTLRAHLRPSATLVPMSKRLVIVESPAKARTIKNFLGPEFEVESSIGHIRDLPERAADVPAKYKKEKWARLGVNVERDFQPLYVVDSEKKQRVADLKKRLNGADELLLATDEDREGE